MQNVIFRNSALVEVIVEIQWELVPVSTVPNGAVDPYYLGLRESLEREFSQMGLGVVEPLVPAQIPLELLPWKPTVRFRSASDKWPLYQLGPGLFTANFANGYNGWPTFSQFVFNGLTVLLERFPAHAQLLKVKKLNLTYIDLFSEQHGYKSFKDFSSKLFPLSLPFSQEYFQEFGDVDAIGGKIEISIPLKSPGNSKGSISILSGARNNSPALKVQYSVDSEQLACDLMVFREWLEAAHVVLRGMFERSLSEELREKLRPEEV